MKIRLFFILTALICFLQINKSIAETIKPTTLTVKETINFNVVNELAQNAFKDIKLKINTDSFSPTYSELSNSGVTGDLSTFYYIQKDSLGEYYYDVATKKLKSIIIFQNTNSSFSRVSYEYDYKSGKLLTVIIKISPDETLNFNDKGEYIDYKNYLSSLSRKMEKRWLHKMQSRVQ